MNKHVFEYLRYIGLVDLAIDYRNFYLSKIYGLELLTQPKHGTYDLVVIAVSHNSFKKMGINKIKLCCNKTGSIIDLKNTFSQNKVDFSI